MSLQLQHLLLHRKVHFIFQNVTLVFILISHFHSYFNLTLCFGILRVLHDPVLTFTMLKLKAERHSFILYFHGNLLHVKNTADGKLKVSTNGTTGLFFPFPLIMPHTTDRKQSDTHYFVCSTNLL